MHRKTIIDFKELGQRYLFDEPLVELVAKSLDQVGPVIEKIQHYQQLGYYVVGYLSYEAAAFFDNALQTHNDRLGNEYLAYFTVHKTCQKKTYLLIMTALLSLTNGSAPLKKKPIKKPLKPFTVRCNRAILIRLTTPFS